MNDENATSYRRTITPKSRDDIFKQFLIDHNKSALVQKLIKITVKTNKKMEIYEKIEEIPFELGQIERDKLKIDLIKLQDRIQAILKKLGPTSYQNDKVT